MISLLGLVNIIGSATEQAVRYLDHHHWFFGIILIGYMFRLHDKSIHARFSARLISGLMRLGNVLLAIFDRR